MRRGRGDGGRTRRGGARLWLALAAASTTAFADPPVDDAPLAVGSVSQFNFVDSGEGLAGGGLEYRWAPLGRLRLVPGAGVRFAEGGTVYAYGALLLDLPLGRSWFVAPVVGAGWFRNTDSLDLGYPVEFKTGLEVSRRIAGRYRIGLQAYHLSNASLDEDNPGTEVLELVFAVPLGGVR